MVTYKNAALNPPAASRTSTGDAMAANTNAVTIKRDERGGQQPPEPAGVEPPEPDPAPTVFRSRSNSRVTRNPDNTKNTSTPM